MISIPPWCAAALAALASAVLATAAFAQENVSRLQLRIAPQNAVEPLILGTEIGAPVARLRLAPHACAGTELPPTSRTLEIARAATLCLLNAERALRGLAPLREPSPLSQASQAYSERMVDERFFAHEQVGYFLAGTYWVAGQNLAWGEGPLAAPDRIVEGWMASPGHKRNILDPAFGEVGVGIATGSPAPRSRLNAATYTTDFGVVDGSPTAREAAGRPATVKKSAKRRGCASGERAASRTKTGAKRKYARCLRRPAASGSRSRAGLRRDDPRRVRTNQVVFEAGDVVLAPMTGR